MSSKKLFSLKNLNYFYLFINLLSYALILGVIAIVANNCYHLCLHENAAFQESKLATGGTAHMDVFLQNALWSILTGIAKISVCLAVVLSIKFLIFKAPIPASYLIDLDKNNEISAILGRFLSYHFRRNTSINFSTLVFLNQDAEYEKYILQNHSKKNKFDYFLKKYDGCYETDLNN